MFQSLLQYFRIRVLAAAGLDLLALLAVVVLAASVASGFFLACCGLFVGSFSLTSRSAIVALLGGCWF